MRRTVLRETRNSRAIALIFLPFTWNSRRTRPIVSTVSIPASPSSATRTNEGILNQAGWGQDCTPITPVTGAKLHAGSHSGLLFLGLALLGSVATMYGTLGRQAETRDLKQADAMAENRTLAERLEALETAKTSAK